MKLIIALDIDKNKKIPVGVNDTGDSLFSSSSPLPHLLNLRSTFQAPPHLNQPNLSEKHIYLVEGNIDHVYLLL